jgi:hypothetical protein
MHFSQISISYGTNEIDDCSLLILFHILMLFINRLISLVSCSYNFQIVPACIITEPHLHCVLCVGVKQSIPYTVIRRQGSVSVRLDSPGGHVTPSKLNTTVTIRTPTAH